MPSLFVSRAILLVLPAALLCADQVVLKNGDRFTGNIVKKDAKTLTIKTGTYGAVAVPWEEVSVLRTDAAVHVETSAGQTLQGVVELRDGTLQVGGRSIPIAEIAFIRDDTEQRAHERLLNPGLMQVWAGTATFGLAGTQGNAETRTLTFGVNAARVTRTDKASLYFNAIKASALLGGVDATTAQAVRGGWGYARNLGDRLFVNVFNDYEYDRFQNLDLRFVLGGGLGYSVWKTDRGQLDLSGGFAYNREKFSPQPPEPGFSRDSAEAYVGDQFAYKLNAVTSIYQTLRFFPNLSSGGAYRVNFDLGAATKLARWLTWNIAISDRYLSNPFDGRKKNDFLYTTGIGVTFER